MNEQPKQQRTDNLLTEVIKTFVTDKKNYSETQRVGMERIINHLKKTLPYE